MVRSFVERLLENWQTPSKTFMMLASAFVFFVWRSSMAISVCLICGCLMSLYTHTESKKKMSMKAEEMLRSANFGPLFGKNSIYLFLSIYLILWFSSATFGLGHFTYIYVDYFAGSLIIGPVYTTFVYFYAEFLGLGLLSKQQLWLGIPLAFMSPGSVLNIGVYMGSIIDGLRGALLSVIFLFIPCFLLLYGALPQWSEYRNKAGIQRLSIGLTCISTGFVLGMILLGLEYCLQTDVSITLTIFFVSVFMNYISGFYTVFIVLIGGLLANARRWGLIYYRMMPDQ